MDFSETYGNLVGILKSLAAPLDALAIRRLVAQNGLADLSYALTALAGEPQPVLLEDAREALERFRARVGGRSCFSVARIRSAGTRHPAGTPDRPGAGACAQAWLDDGCPTDETAVLAFLAACAR